MAKNQENRKKEKSEEKGWRKSEKQEVLLAMYIEAKGILNRTLGSVVMGCVM